MTKHNFKNTHNSYLLLDSNFEKLYVIIKISQRLKLLQCVPKNKNQAIFCMPVIEYLLKMLNNSKSCCRTIKVS